MPKTGFLQSLCMEDPARTRNETTDQPRSAMRRRSVQYFKRADSWFNRFVRLAAVVHEGFWLGCLSADDLNAITAEHYDHSHESASPEHNLRGFLDWELAMVNRHFPPGSRILVAAAGGGREVLALRRAGYTADGFECNPILVQASDAIFEQLGEARGVMLCPADHVPPGPPGYGGLIVGWSAHTHIPTRARRVAFLQALRQRALPGSPVLLSFFTRTGASRYDGFVCKVANLFRVLRGGKESVELGDHLSWSYSHLFTGEEIEGEMRDAGIRMVHYGEVGDGHAVGIVE
jgi:hypothetical protein